MTKEIAAPAIPKELLDYLQQLYPEQSADPSWTDREIWMRAGKRELVRSLAALCAQQNESLLGPTIPKSRVLRKVSKSSANPSPTPSGPATG